MPVLGWFNQEKVSLPKILLLFGRANGTLIPLKKGVHQSGEENSFCF
jgi:hypothetical protein